MENYAFSTRHCNRQYISQNKECERIILEMKEVEEFVSDFGTLSFGRNIAFCGRNLIPLQLIMNGSELTLGSVISCCESGCMADAYSLLRKYRDDLFFYLYIVVYNTLDRETNNATKMEANIERWIKNNLKDLKISDVLTAIGRSAQVEDAIQEYNLKDYFASIGDRLNDYVHSNGVSFYNQSVYTYRGHTLQKQMHVLLEDMNAITITFLFLLSLCSPLSIMSTDYVDHLEFNKTPPDESQYWVAPFVNDYFKKNAHLIDKSCIEYLRKKTLMQFER